MQKTLGGDRLGAGKKMKVHLHNYERSTHDIGYVFRTTMSAGTLVPFMSEVALPGTTFDINLGCDVKTHPTIGPLFGSYKTQLDIFLCPIRLYNSAMHNNTLGIGRMMSTVKLPKIEMKALGVDVENQAQLDTIQINPSSLLPYVGIRGIGLLDSAIAEEQTRKFNAVPILAYWEIYKNYYANKQEEIGAVIHNDNVEVTATVTGISIIQPGGGIVAINKVPPGILQTVLLVAGTQVVITFAGTQPKPEEIYFYQDSEQGTIKLSDLCEPFVLFSATELVAQVKPSQTTSTIRGWNYIAKYDIRYVQPTVTTFTLANIDTARQALLASGPAAEWKINDIDLEPYKWLYEQPNGVPNVLSSQEGLAIKTYQSDLFNNWLKTENIEAISTTTAIDTTGGSFTIDAFIISKKVWQMLNRINVSGGSYDDWMDAVYVHDRYKSQESPMYMGGLIKELVFQEVVSNSESTSGQPLGTLAGKGTMAGKHKGGQVVIHIDEPSYVIGIVSLTPRVDYSQGNKWDVHLDTMDDFHKPALDEIGFQELITEQMAWWDTTGNGTTWTQRSAGKQPAWLNYMTNVNRVYGNFAIPDNEMFMVLNRRYEVDNPDSGPGLIKDLTTYIDPSKFNFIFAETSLDAQNFWVQIGVDITARRKMSGKLMPNL